MNLTADDFKSARTMDRFWSTWMVSTARLAGLNDTNMAQSKYKKVDERCCPLMIDNIDRGSKLMDRIKSKVQF